VSANARSAAFVLGALMVAGGTLLSVMANGAGIPLLIVGVLIVVTVFFEPRYGRPGAPTSVPNHAWELTSERFIDDETGQALEVWVDPLTGERRYEPIPAHRQLTEDSR
jgi:hypothetical protein